MKMLEWQVEGSSSSSLESCSGQCTTTADITRLHRLQLIHNTLSDALKSGLSERPPQRVENAFVDESPVDDFNQRIPNLALSFPFPLDSFQKRAILRVEQRHSVFVGAHTSAGKTVVAEYAIALAAKNRKKVIYTAPIKTLSNQKFRDFRNRFDDVGLITGDISINSRAQCIIMTTEILRSMLYRGSKTIDDVSYVVFDEVQFLNDKLRGVVWEESIIMLPKHVTIIMLSATVPNALEFASWVGTIRNSPVAVIHTDERPVPLQHSIVREHQSEIQAAVVINAGDKLDRDGLNRVIEEAVASSWATSTRHSSESTLSHFAQGPVVNENFRKRSNTHCQAPVKTDADRLLSSASADIKLGSMSMERLLSIGSGSERPSSGRNSGSNRSNRALDTQSWSNLVNFLACEKQLPAVIFIFSRKLCEAAVLSLKKNDLLPDEKDKEYVRQFFDNAIERLNEEDRCLPQLQRVRESLQCGFAAHHAGLLPIVKEVTEILLSKGLVKVLFATDTFAMGVNMPARTVVFSAIKKSDGRSFRYLEAGEYMQMSGRAGRRGIDCMGHVYLYLNERNRLLDKYGLGEILSGKPASLKSAFRLSYNMILNAMRLHELQVEEIMMQSFSEASGVVTKKCMAEICARTESELIELHAEKEYDFDDMDNRATELQDPVDRRGEGSPSVGIKQLEQKYIELRKLSKEMDADECYSIYNEFINLGRLVVVELQPGHLSLAVIFAFDNQEYDEEGLLEAIEDGFEEFFNEEDFKPYAISKDTQIWVAGLMSLVDTDATLQVPSVLLMPASEDVPLSSESLESVAYTTEDGLQVALRKTTVGSIMYICNSVDPNITVERNLRQSYVAAKWGGAQAREFASECLVTNAEYLQDIMQLWSSEGKDRVFHEHLNEVTKFSREQGGLGVFYSEHYKSRLRLCKDIIRSTALYHIATKSVGKRFGSRIQEAVLVEDIRSKMSEMQELIHSKAILFPEYRRRVEMLQSLNYVSDDETTILLKGRCASTVSTVDSLVLTEIVVDGVLQGLCPAEVASLLSSLVCFSPLKAGRRNNFWNWASHHPRFAAARRKMEFTVNKVGEAELEHGLRDLPDMWDCDDGNSRNGYFEVSRYVDKVCKWDLAIATYAWANGASFQEVTELTDLQEGDIVICVKRLGEVMRDAQQIAKMTRNNDLSIILEEALGSIRRDYMFNGSIYFDEETEMDI